MQTTEYAGIDYGLGQSNRNKQTGIRFGVIPANDVGQAWFDSSEAQYPECEDEDCDCEPLAFTLDDGQYKAEQSGDDCDIFILSAPFYTFAQFCSPCAPGACYLRSPLSGQPDNNKCYCFGHDWFEDGKAPYPVYSVETGQPVEPEATQTPA